MKPRTVVPLFALLACARGEAPTPDSAAAAPNVVTVTARDFAFDAPDTIPAGLTTIGLQVESGLHHAQLIRLTEGKTFAEFVEAVRAMKPGDKPPAWAEDAGGPNPPEPGAAASVTQVLEPGNYAIVCFVDVPDKVPHIAKGMAKALVVVPAPAGAPVASEPSPDVTMQLVDYTFQLSTPLTSGSRTIRVENGASQPHEVFIGQFLPGKTMEDLGKWAQTYDGPPPVKALGGVAALKPGASATFTVDLVPGDYVLVCFVPDAGDGKPHVDHGMVMPVKIG